MAVDERFIKALHVESLRRRDLHAGAEPHEIFQTSTIEALLEGAYDGDVTFGELAEHGDLGLGTLDALDGEMIAVEGRFFRAAVDGTVSPVDGSTRTPFAVVTEFAPGTRLELAEATDQAAALSMVSDRVDSAAPCQALRIDGSFEVVRARSVPRQRRPYPPLVEVVAQQQVFELRDVEGTIVGFRFPDYAGGLNVPGYHLHFVTGDRSRGGHVLDFRCRQGTVELDQSADVHVELPAGVELDAAAPSDAALRRVEHEG